jgi:hypothetical protein
MKSCELPGLVIFTDISAHSLSPGRVHFHHAAIDYLTD